MTRIQETLTKVGHSVQICSNIASLLPNDHTFVGDNKGNTKCLYTLKSATQAPLHISCSDQVITTLTDTTKEQQ